MKHPMDRLYSPAELSIAKSVRRKTYEENIMDFEAYCSNADNGHGLDITTGRPLPTEQEWLLD